MRKSYLKIAWRNLMKNKGFSLINITGLAIGLTCSMLMAVFVADELSYDRYPTDSGNIYRVILSVTGNGDEAAYPNVDNAIGPGMKDAVPEVEDYTRLVNASDFVRHEDVLFKENKLAFVDANFLRFFSIPLLEGNMKDALAEPNAIVLSRNMARRYFGDRDAVGQTLEIGMNHAVYKVTGVFDKVPDNSHFHFDAFMSLATWHLSHLTWSNIGWYTYLKLNPQADLNALKPKFRQLVAEHVVPEVQHDMGVSLAEAEKAINSFVFSLQPLQDIHLYSHTKYELEPNGDIQYVYIFSALAVFVLLLACVNFTNLSTARSVKRAKEVGVRKAMGSARGQLIRQFLTESVLLSVASMLLAFLLIGLLLSSFNALSGKHIDFQYFVDYRFLLAAVGLSLAVGVVAGVYPAFFLSSFNPVKVLKGVSLARSQNNSLRSGLIIFQFFISTALVFATIIVYQQLHYLQNKKLGYDSDQVLFIPDGRLLGNNQRAFKQQLLDDSHVESVSLSRSVPGDPFMGGTEVFPKNEDSNGKEIHINIYQVDYDYLKTLGIKLVTGRNFSRDIPSDSLEGGGAVINEAAVAQLGWSHVDPIGRTIVGSGQRILKVIGVVADFNYTSAREAVAPLMMLLGHNEGGIVVKISTADVSGFLTGLKKKWDAFSPAGPLSYQFLDDKFAALYTREQGTQKIFSAFTLVAMIIAALGLFGLSAYVMEQRTKEIGIRKVLGASVRQVLVLVSREFLVLVLIAFLISVPVTWWTMQHWLQDYAYRIHVGPGVFILSGVTVLLIAILTISSQAIKSALSDPVKSLRSE